MTGEEGTFLVLGHRLLHTATDYGNASRAVVDVILQHADQIPDEVGEALREPLRDAVEKLGRMTEATRELTEFVRERV